MLTILASFSQEESRSISENVKWGKQKRFQSGEFSESNKHIFGYRYDDELEQYVVIPEEAKVVRMMFQMYLDGVSYPKIADAMNETGLKTVNGNAFTFSSVASMVHNEIYSGNLVRQKYFTENHISKKRPRNRGELPKYYIQDAHEAIIDSETYAKVLEEQKRRKPLTFPFTSKIKCGICGKNYCRMASGQKSDSSVRWSCLTRMKNCGECSNIVFKNQELESICANVMETEQFDASLFAELIKGITVQANQDIVFDFVDGTQKTFHYLLTEQRKKLPKVRFYNSYFDNKLFCAICGRPITRKKKWNSRTEYYWQCHRRGNIPCESVRYEENVLKQIMCEMWNLEEFDEYFFHDIIDKIVVQPTGTLDFYLKDGTIRHFHTLILWGRNHESTLTKAFYGKFRCPDCGRVFTRHYDPKSGYSYWKCSGAYKKKVMCPNVKAYPDYDLQQICAFLMGDEQFNETKFMETVDHGEILQGDKVQLYFKEGEMKEWRRLQKK